MSIALAQKDLYECNTVFITLDSCRYDTATKAKLSTLSSLGSLLKTRSPATYTLPAHISFFVGYLPSVFESDPPLYYSAEKRQLWRLNTARKRNPATVGLLLDGNTIFDGFRKLGYYIVGAGGSGWFNSPLLNSLFDSFHFPGPTNHDNIWRSRRIGEFVSTYVEELIADVAQSEKWFLFLNCVETHAPYDTGDSIPDEIQELFGRIHPAWGGKRCTAMDLHVTEQVLAPVHRQQIKALEILDRRIGRLFDGLPKNRPILAVICGDHGEGFGEEFVWGHGVAIEPVLTVPLIIGLV